MALAAVMALAVLGDCRQFFVKQVVVAQPVVQAVAVSPYIYQAGRDIEADALAAKVAALVAPKIVEQLKAAGGTAAQPLAAPVVQPLVAQHCAKCHSGAAPKAGLVLDGTTPLLCSQITASLRQLAADKMPQDHQIAPSVKGAIMQELLDLERKEPMP